MSYRHTQFHFSSLWLFFCYKEKQNIWPWGQFSLQCAITSLTLQTSIRLAWHIIFIMEQTPTQNAPYHKPSPSHLHPRPSHSAPAPPPQTHPSPTPQTYCSSFVLKWLIKKYDNVYSVKKSQMPQIIKLWKIRGQKFIRYQMVCNKQFRNK